MEHPKLFLTIPWESIDLKAQQQIIKIVHMPELKALAIMPDVHAGYDLCIGGVALMDRVISPSFVGYDIGCGMCHISTGKTLKELDLDSYKNREEVYKKIEFFSFSGVGKKHKQDFDFTFTSACGDKNLDKKITPFIHKQLGTLGSGNHFLEIGVNAEGIVGVTIHSGSRRCGYDIASHYMRLLHFAPWDSDLGQAYLADMNWALDFALKNRKAIITGTLEAIGLTSFAINKLIESSQFINETHNHAVVDKENGNVLHRKGATPAEKDQLGVIPANQRDGVYITRGLGNNKYLSSASHGAGRKMTRTEAKLEGDVGDLKEAMKGICCKTDKKILDEAPWVYKDIDIVLAAQNGILVDIVDHFKPLIVLKN